MQWNTFHLKLVGILTMLIDHIGKIFFPQILGFQFVGRIAFPLFAWMIANGYQYTRDVKRYLSRLFIFALLSQVPYTWAFHGFSTHPLHYLTHLNIMFTLFLGLLAIVCYERISYKLLGILAVILFALIGGLLDVSYGLMGVLVVFLFHYFRDNYLKLLEAQLFLFFLSYILTLFVAFETSVLLTIALYMVFTVVPFLLIRFYNGKMGPSARYFFYIFYPGHLLVLYSIYLVLQPR